MHSSKVSLDFLILFISWLLLGLYLDLVDSSKTYTSWKSCWRRAKFVSSVEHKFIGEWKHIFHCQIFFKNRKCPIGDLHFQPHFPLSNTWNPPSILETKIHFHLPTWNPSWNCKNLRRNFLDNHQTLLYSISRTQIKYTHETIWGIFTSKTLGSEKPQFGCPRKLRLVSSIHADSITVRLPITDLILFFFFIIYLIDFLVYINLQFLKLIYIFFFQI